MTSGIYARNSTQPSISTHGWAPDQRRDLIQSAPFCNFLVAQHRPFIRQLVRTGRSGGTPAVESQDFLRCGWGCTPPSCSSHVDDSVPDWPLWANILIGNLVVQFRDELASRCPSTGIPGVVVAAQNRCAHNHERTFSAFWRCWASTRPGRCSSSCGTERYCCTDLAGAQAVMAIRGGTTGRRRRRSAGDPGNRLRGRSGRQLQRRSGA